MRHVFFSVWPNNYYIIDAPSHRKYISEVLSKLIWADIALIVVSVKENQFDTAFYKWQLKEHVMLCKGSCIDNVIVVMNDINLVGCGRKSFDLIRKKAKKVFENSSFSWQLVSFVPCSNKQDQDTFNPYHNSWHHGYFLLKCIESKYLFYIMIKAFWVLWAVLKIIFVEQRLSKT